MRSTIFSVPPAYYFGKNDKKKPSPAWVLIHRTSSVSINRPPISSHFFVPLSSSASSLSRSTEAVRKYPFFLYNGTRFSGISPFFASEIQESCLSPSSRFFTYLRFPKPSRNLCSFPLFWPFACDLSGVHKISTSICFFFFLVFLRLRV